MLSMSSYNGTDIPIHFYNKSYMNKISPAFSGFVDMLEAFHIASQQFVSQKTNCV